MGMMFDITPDLKNPSTSYEKALKQIVDHYSFEPHDDITLDAISYNFKRIIDDGQQIIFSPDQSGNITIQLRFQSREECFIWKLKWA
jgi:hypothetical protein